MDETPHDRLRRLGLNALTASDLLAIACAETEDQAEEISSLCTHLLVKRGIRAFGQLSPADLLDVAPLEPELVTRILAAIEIGRRSGLSGKGQVTSISKPKDIAALFKYLEDETREHFCVVYLNAKNGILGTRTIHVGTATTSLVGVRDVYREAIREGATQIAVVHNHPSGDPTPSIEDIDVTDKLVEAGKLMDVQLIDHIIIGHHTFVSLKEKGCV